MKDYFSQNADLYAKYRPAYPDALFQMIEEKYAGEKLKAWDCGTGNGQIAARLADFMKEVYASDISSNQLLHAVKRPNITYSLQRAESVGYTDQQFDLIVVAQAIHWFDFEKFYKEVFRTAKAGAFIVVTGYGNLKINQQIDQVIHFLYENILGTYWDPARIYVDEEYQTIPFPFEDQVVPKLSNNFTWTLSHLMGYLHTWSAVRHYHTKNGNNPLALIEQDLKDAWGEQESREVQFPLVLRVGKIKE